MMREEMRLDSKLNKINDDQYLDKLSIATKEASDMIAMMKRQIKNGFKETERAGKEDYLCFFRQEVG